MQPSIKISRTSHELLRNEIEETFGKKISAAGDCVLLSEEVYHKISFKVSSNTLRRFFGLVRSDFLPSSTTLNILSNYCGFSSYEEFLRLKDNPANAAAGDYYSTSILNYLHSVFKHTPVKGAADKTFQCVTEYTVRFLQRHPQLIDKFQRDVSKTRNGQDFYFEQCVNIDALNGYYGDGLRYYLREKKTAEAQVFGHSLLCLRSWFCEDPTGIQKHYEGLIKHPPFQHLPSFTFRSVLCHQAAPCKCPGLTDR